MKAKHLPKFIIAMLMVALVAPMKATTYKTIAHGAWNDPGTWSCNCVPAAVSFGHGDTINVQHAVTMSTNIAVHAPDRINVHLGASLTANGPGANEIYINSDGGQLNYGGFNIWGAVTVDHIRNVNASWIFVEATGTLSVNGDFDNSGDLYASGIVEVLSGDFNHNSNDIWIYTGGNILVQDGNFNNHSTIRNLFPNSCVRVIGGSFFNLAGAEIYGGGGVIADLDIDNSANPITNWVGASWCAGGNGINIDPGLENCGGPCSAPLEVDLVSFYATPMADGTVDVQWVTTRQNGSAYFRVERSSDAQNFEQVGTTSAAGTSDVTARYSLTDDFPYAGVTFYRLAEVDVDGNTSYSHVVAVYPDIGTTDFLLFPNPASDRFSVMIGTSQLEAAWLRIYDQRGQLATEHRITSAQPSVDIPHLRPGIYFVTVVSGESTSTHRLLVQ